MEKCKFCQAELEENSTVCPACGKDNAEHEMASAQEPVEAPAAEPTAEETPAAESAAEAAAEEVTDIEAAAEDVPAEEAPAEDAPVEEIAENADAAEKKVEKKPVSKLEIAIFVALICVLIALVGVLISQGQQRKAAAAQETAPEEQIVEATIPPDGDPGNITCKGTYTVTDEELAENRANVVATCGNSELTLGQLQTYYWMEVRSFLNAYGAYAAYFGMDMNQSLDTQKCGVAEGVTWQQYFLESALNSWQNYESMAQEAKNLKVEMLPDAQIILDAMDEDLETAAATGGYDSVDAMLSSTMGPGATAEEYKGYMQTYYEGFSYYQSWADANAPTDEEVESYFAEHEEEYSDNGITKDTATIDVRHILVMPEETTNDAGETVMTDEAWAEAEKAAKEILKQWKSGDKSEESFAALATEKTQDPGSQSTGGLYTGVTEGQMVPAFNDWCFDAVRKTGDTDIVKTNYGYHVMYFVSRNIMWQNYAKSDLSNERSGEFMQSVSMKYPIEVDFSKLMLGDLKLA